MKWRRRCYISILWKTIKLCVNWFESRKCNEAIMAWCAVNRIDDGTRTHNTAHRDTRTRKSRVQFDKRKNRTKSRKRFIARILKTPTTPKMSHWIKRHSSIITIPKSNRVHFTFSLLLRVISQQQQKKTDIELIFITTNILSTADGDGTIWRLRHIHKYNSFR